MGFNGPRSVTIYLRRGIGYPTNRNGSYSKAGVIRFGSASMG